MRCLSYAEALRQKLLLVSFTLFSMFFGAGNLIFPPHLGAQAGTSLWPALRALSSAPSACPLRRGGCGTGRRSG